MTRTGTGWRTGVAISLAGALLMLLLGPGCIDVARLMATPTAGPEAGVTVIVPVPATATPGTIVITPQPPTVVVPAATPQPPVFATANPPTPEVAVPSCPTVTLVTPTPCGCGRGTGGVP